MNINWSEVLGKIFTDHRFKEFSIYQFYGEIDGGLKVGVVLATQNQGFLNPALNKEMVGRLRDAKVAGKVDYGFVVQAEVNGSKRVYRGHRDVEEVCQQIEMLGLQPRAGKMGEFFVLVPGIIPIDANAPW